MKRNCNDCREAIGLDALSGPRADKHRVQSSGQVVDFTDRKAMSSMVPRDSSLGYGTSSPIRHIQLNRIT